MDYQTLKKIKNKNVQQQNQLTFLEIRRTAKAFKQKSLSYPWLLELFAIKNVDFTKGILIECGSTPGPDCNYWYATWLTFGKRFIDIEVLADHQTDTLLEVEVFKQKFPEITAHNKGTGKSFGYLALAVLRKLTDQVQCND